MQAPLNPKESITRTMGIIDGTSTWIYDDMGLFAATRHPFLFTYSPLKEGKFLCPFLYNG